MRCQRVSSAQKIVNEIKLEMKMKLEMEMEKMATDARWRQVIPGKAARISAGRARACSTVA